ncbi:MAG: VWA domain-containing protein [Lachnospiraceae bacterium]|nr:VWA domain-containing protein [Lachnospiraceae bacterium]
MKKRFSVAKKLTAMTLAAALLTGCGLSTAQTGGTTTGQGGTTELSGGTAQGNAPVDMPVTMETEATYDASAPDMVYGSRKGSGSAMAPASAEAYDWFYQPAPNAETYEKAPENGFYITAASPLSTFSASVDTASYANVRRMIENGYSLSEIPADAVRAEEFINYFRYNLNAPAKGEKFGLTTEMAACPWNEKHKLLFVGMRTQDIDFSDKGDSNLVFLIDVSGSMDEDNKLPLLVKSFKQLTENLTEKDRVSIVTYANGVETVLNGAKGSDRQEIFDALDSLEASGGTGGEGGIQKAYELAESSFIDGGINRVILATDGDFNIGISDPDALQRLIESKRDSGVYLSVLGFGMGNYRDDMMQRLSQYGSGNYAYIDSLLEAKRVLVEEMGATLVTVAEDVKLQVEFNPEKVNAYRLVGYENRMLEATDFNDDTKDAGEIGAGHSVVALYEIIEKGAEDEIELRYGQQGEAAADATEFANEYALVKIRYKEPGESASKLVEQVLDESILMADAGENLRFASLAAEFAMVLSNSQHKGTATLDGILEAYKTIDTGDDEYKNEFYYLVRKLSGKA